ncbi:MAG TPA: M23 family metallopeptidase, partial [Thermoanaerobaculia bacterium]
MKTFVTLAAGWCLGALLVFAMNSNAGRASAPPVAIARTEIGRAEARPTLLIPVQGVAATELRDTFTQARSGGRRHDAIDILAPRGTPVLAAVDGTVRKLFVSRAGGLTIYEFDQLQRRVYYYAHLDRYASIREGDAIRQGEVIGYVGTT